MSALNPSRSEDLVKGIVGSVRSSTCVYEKVELMIEALAAWQGRTDKIGSGPPYLGCNVLQETLLICNAMQCKVIYKWNRANPVWFLEVSCP